ncbi:MAG: YfhO family protein, partial [Huintestinicola sp.]
MKTDKKPLSLFEDHSKEKYLSVFLTAFVISAAVFLLMSLAQRGPFIYYGDYNMQQIPFYYHVHEAVRSGRFMWDFSTDLGTDLMESYSFYLMGSPFFWLTVPFPSAALPYIMPWMLSLKTAVAALTAYAYIRGFTNNTAACFMGGMLYAFSGFQVYNLMFNHFHDATAFFPLLLLASDRLAMKKDKGLFGAAVLLCAVSNYFFFAEMAVFTVIYYIVNIAVGRYKFTVKGFINYGFEAVLGVCAAAVVLLPSAGAVMGNNRAASHITPEYMLIYRNTLSTYIHIIKGFFTLPDLCLFHALPSSDEIECSSVSAYLPFVSVCGVFGYFARKPKKDMPAAMFVISLICMAVPVLNSMFYMFNIAYYARWFFMPILIMCVMTAVTVSEDVMLLKKSILPCMGVNAVILIGGLIYKGTVKTSALDSAETVNTTYLTYITIGSIGCLALLYSMLSDKSLTDNKARLTALNKRVSAACAVIMLASVSLGVAAFRDSKNYRNFFFESIDDVEELKNSDENSGLFFRTETCESYRNSNFMWDTSSSVSFISLIPQSMTEFYDKIGFPRGVVTTTIPNYESLRAMLSVKYYFDMPLEIDGQMLTPSD